MTNNDRQSTPSKQQHGIISSQLEASNTSSSNRCRRHSRCKDKCKRISARKVWRSGRRVQFVEARISMERLLQSSIKRKWWIWQRKWSWIRRNFSNKKWSLSPSARKSTSTCSKRDAATYNSMKNSLHSNRKSKEDSCHLILLKWTQARSCSRQLQGQPTREDDQLEDFSF